MHVVVLAEDFYPNVSGGAHARWRFCQIAVEKGAEVTVFTPIRGDSPRRETVDGIDIRRPCRAQPRGLPAYGSISFITRLLASLIIFAYAARWFFVNDADGIHSASNTYHWSAKLLGLVFGLPIVNFVGYTPSYSRDQYSQFEPKILLERLTFRWCMGATVFCRSPEIRDIITRAGNDDVRILHGIINVPRVKRVARETVGATVQNKLGVGPDTRLLGFVGRLSPLKRPEEAVRIVGDMESKANLIMVGDGPKMASVRRTLDQLSLRDCVTLLGELPHEEALKYISALDVLVVTSRAEAYPTIVFEALSFEKHVVAPPVGILPEIDHPNLHVVDPGKFPGFIDDLQVDDRSGLDEEVLEMYGLERYAEDILDALESHVANTQ